MPNWKKLLYSGSNGSLNTLNVTTAFTASGINYPTVDGTSGQALVTDGSGSLSFSTISSGTTTETGSLLVTASAAGSVITFEKGDGSTFDVTVSSEVTPANALVTASLSGTTLTFEKGNATTFDIILPPGGYTGSNATAHLNQTVAATTWSFVHNLDDRYPVFTVYDNSGDIIIPNRVETVDKDNANIYFSTARTGTATAVIASSISQISSITEDFTNQSTVAVTHSLDTRNIHVSVYDTNHSLIVPQSVTLDTLDTVVVTFPSAQSGTVVVAKGGHVISGTATTAFTASYVEYDNVANKPTLISSSAQIASDISGSLTEFSSSITTRVENLEAFSSSLNATYATDAELSAVSGAIASDITDIIDGTTIVASASYALTASYGENFVISGSINLNGYTWPTTDGTYGVEILTTDGAGGLTFEIPTNVYETVKNVSGGPLVKGTPVHATGSATSGNTVGVIAADALDPSKMPATYVLHQNLADEEEGLGIAVGFITGIDTRGLVEGEPVYVGAGGGWTQTKPTGSALIQNLGIVTKVAENGSGVVLGAGRSNDVPNITQGYAWVGNADQVATATPTASFFVTSGSHALNADDAISASYAANAELLDGLNSTQFLRSDQTGTLTGDLTVTGTLTAQEFHTEFVSASIIFESGSTQFGNSADDIHVFTGSVNIEGDVTATSYTGIFVGALSSSAQIASDISGSFTSVSSSIATDISNIIDGTTTVTSASYAVSSSYSSNANLLDGINSTQFLRNDQNGTLLGNLQITGSLDVTGNINATSFTGSIAIGEEDTLTIGSQKFFPQGNNGFSVNEDFDPSNSSLQTAYHFTSGVGRETVAFTLARTGQFTDGFGIYGTAADNTFVMFGEQNNTSFEWRRGVGIRPLDLDGGTLLARLNTAGQFSANSISASNGITGSLLGTATSALAVEFTNILNKPALLSGSAQIASEISGSFTSVSSSIASDITDIIDGTTTVTSASYALTASYALNVPVTASYALTASYVDPTYISASAAASGFGTGGVTSIIAGTGISVDQSTGDVTITATGGGGGSGFPFSGSAVITGSLFVSGGLISGSFKGDGSQLTGIDVGTVTTIGDTFTSQTQVVVTHNFNTRDVNVVVYNDSNEYIIPDTITLSTLNTVTVDFAVPTSGRIVVTKGGHIISALGLSSKAACVSTASFSATGSSFYYDVVFDSAFDTANYSVTLQAHSQYAVPTSFPGHAWVDSNKAASGFRIVVPSFDDTMDEICWTAIAHGESNVTASNAQTASFVEFNNIANKPTLISSSLQFNTVSTPFTGSFSGSFYGDGSNLSGVTSYTDADTLTYINTLGVVSSSAQINTGSFTGSFFGDGTGLTGLGYGETKKLNQTVAATTWSFNHNMDEQYPTVTVYNSSNEVIQPSKIEAVSNSTLNLYFGIPTAGTAVAVVGGVALTQEAGFNRTLSQTVAATTWSFAHNLGQKYPQITVYDVNDELIIPGKVEAVDQNNALLYFDTAQAGTVAATVGGTASTASYADTLTVVDTLLSTQENTDVDTGTETVATVSTSLYDGAFFDYVIKDGTNYRAGTVMAVWDGTSVQYNDNSTADIGDTSPVTMSVDISGTDARLRATTSSDNWNIKAFVRAL